MPTIDINTTTKVGVDELLDKLLTQENVTPEIVKIVQKRLARIVMPWEKDGWGPPRWVRKMASGEIVGVVDSHLGGYGDAHYPRFHGWGYQANTPAGQGVCTSGIIKVDTGTLVVEERGSKTNDVELKQCEDRARGEAMTIVDEFLAGEFPMFTFLEDGE